MSGISGLSGMFVGSLSDDELEEFNKAVSEGKARRVYEGAGAILGMAKVRLILPPIHEDEDRDYRLHSNDYL